MEEIVFTKVRLRVSPYRRRVFGKRVAGQPVLRHWQITFGQARRNEKAYLKRALYKSRISK